MSKDELIEMASRLSAEDMLRIGKCLYEASMRINEVEHILFGVNDNHRHPLLLDSPTLWCNIYDLEQIFNTQTTNK